jgi:hypothetical protein
MVVKFKVPEKEGVKIDFDKFRYNGSAPNATVEPAGTRKDGTEDSTSATSKKQSTPERPTQEAIATPASTEQLPLSSATNSLHSKSLAYRESPEKLQAPLPAAAPQPLDKLS